jgi:hypothetical protein
LVKIFPKGKEITFLTDARSRAGCLTVVEEEVAVWLLKFKDRWREEAVDKEQPTTLSFRAMNPKASTAALDNFA